VAERSNAAVSKTVTGR